MKTLPLLPFLLATACAVSTHATRTSELGTTRSTADLLAVIDTPGPIELETVKSVDWAVPRSGLINLDHPRAKEAGLTDGDEPIEVDFHVIRHPTQGVFLVDTGFEKALRDNPDTADVRGVVADYMGLEKMHFHAPLGDWLAAHPEPVKGVFFTHLHLDHVGGAGDLPAATALYTGPGEAGASAFLNFFVQTSTDRLLAGKPGIGEWAFKPDASGRFDGVLDIFGDGSVWAFWVPGHTPGSTAYLVRTTSGPVLLTGDACHTRWGWEHDVEPGSFSTDRPRSAESLARLRRLVAEHPGIQVRLGHQRLEAKVAASAQ
jgi:N-acyl homoserine lactone hydrolase